MTLVFASVLGTGAVAGTWSDTFRAAAGTNPQPGGRTPPGTAVNGAPPGGSSTEARAASAARERSAPSGRGDGDAEQLVSRSGDRWSGAYSPREYEGLRQTLDGEYVGVGISVREERQTPRSSPGRAAQRGDRQNGGAPVGSSPSAAERSAAEHSGSERSGDGPQQETMGARSTAPAGDGESGKGQPYVVVARVHPGSPGADAGIRPGDRLRRIDGKAVSGRPITDVVQQLRGSGHGAGTPVALGLSRDGRQWRATLHRARLSADNVAVQQLSGATRIRISSFTRGTGAQVREAVRKQVPRNSGMLLDLRGNSGGLVREAVQVASVFLDGGLVATYDDHGTQRALFAKSGGGDRQRPLVVLTDGGTMSAAELLTGALQDRGRAVTVGARTFGKGSVQLPRQQRDGSVAELTVGHYATPSGNRIDGRGLTPDLPVGSGAKGDATERARTVLGGLATRS